MQRKNEVKIILLVFSHAQNKFFSKILKISAPNSFFPKYEKNLLFTVIGGFFNKFYKLEITICAKEARRLKSKIEFRRLMERMKKRFLDFLAQYKVYGYLKK